MKPILIKGAAGCGKTELVLRAIAASPNSPWEYYAPTHKLAGECAARLKKMSPLLRIAVIKGRDHCPDGKTPMCKKQKRAAALINAGQSVFPLLCLQAAVKDKPPIKCEHFKQCLYIQQFKSADVYFYPHAYLTLERSVLEKRTPYGVVIDESFIMNTVEIIDFPVARLTDSDIPANATALCAELAHAIKNHPEKIREIVFQAHGSELWDRALKALNKVASGIKPDISEQQFNATIKKVKTFKPISILFDNLRRSRYCRHPPQSVQYDQSSGMVTMHHRKDIAKRFNSARQGLPPQAIHQKTILLNASASELITKKYFQEFNIQEIPITRHARVIQCSSTRCSTTSLVPKMNGSEKSKAAAKKHLKDIELLLKRLVNKGCNVLVVGPAAVVGNPATGIKPLIKCQPGVKFAHFNALRGVDQWKDCDTVVVIGRNQPSVTEAERIARAIFFDDPIPLYLTGQWIEVGRGYNYKSGKKGVDVQVHPDPRVQEVVEQIREQESHQAIDRIRLIHNEQIKTVYILSNLPLDIE